MLKAKNMAYEINKELYEKGYITKDEWSTYCMELLETFINYHKDILIRLKEI